MTDRGLARFARSAGQVDGIAPPLARLLRTRRPQAPGAACELCGAPVAGEHRHVVDLERRGLLCACRACALLFVGEAPPSSAARFVEPGPRKFAGSVNGRYRTVPDRYLRVEPFNLPPQAWAALQIPVGMAFVVHNSRLARTVAFYPSPGGATESELPLDAWSEVVAANAVLARVEPDVEAVLLRSGTGGCHVVPVDRCYELVGTLRRHWRGFDGGQEVRAHIEAFFVDVARRCTPAQDRSPAHAPTSSTGAPRRFAEGQGRP